MQIVSFTRAIPYQGIPHAGGEYYYQHLKCLLKKHEVVVLAPNTPRNRSALSGRIPSAQFILLGDGDPRTSLEDLVARVKREFRPVSAPAEMAIAIRQDDAVMRLIRDADLVEFQWSENASLIGRVKKLNSKARTVIVMHDVLLQKYRRRLTLKGGFTHQIRSYFAYVSSMLLESARLRRADEIIVLSDKDRELVSHSKTHANISVVPPPLTAATSDGTEVHGPDGVLFTGAMDRPENDQGVQWFIRHCWPHITRAHRSATFTIAGGSPSKELQRLAQSQPGIVVTGYVEDLDSFYLRSRIFVAPLFQGAGVKFKSVAAMLNGVPVVSTSVGAEGIGDTSCFGAITNDARSFSDAVIDLLKDGHKWTRISRRCRKWASSTYGLVQFERALDRPYRDIHES